MQNTYFYKVHPKILHPQKNSPTV